MNKKLLSRRTAAALAAVALLGTQIAACTTTSPNAQGSDVMTSTNKHATTNSQADSALSRLYTTADGSRELVSRAKGVLVFPSVLNAGLIVGGQYGEGVLRSGARPLGYYNIASASIGFQAGAQSRALVILFMTDDALNKFRASEGWTAGVDATVALAKIGANGAVDTNTARQPVIGFVLTNAGLMAGASIEGTKITKLNE
ncbi:BPSL1445 family SYLF domain-containing lipoprotein [Ralstonia solanacearum]|uniref:BPSL1445 family SYLF domain-containing lipoprotein n=1 Tax=Ralstonia solanacearum TaxID=305 RepID=UPI0005ACD31D|nr:YSC84-related protein [Ralstonia solanacearum]